MSFSAWPCIAYYQFSLLLYCTAPKVSVLQQLPRDHCTNPYYYYSTTSLWTFQRDSADSNKRIHNFQTSEVMNQDVAQLEPHPGNNTVLSRSIPYYYVLLIAN